MMPGMSVLLSDNGTRREAMLIVNPVNVYRDTMKPDALIRQNNGGETGEKVSSLLLVP